MNSLENTALLIFCFGLIYLLFRQIEDWQSFSWSRKRLLRLLLKNHTKINHRSISIEQMTAIDALVKLLNDGSATICVLPYGRIVVTMNLGIVAVSRKKGDYRFQLREHYLCDDQDTPIERPVLGSMGIRIRTRYEDPIEAVRRGLSKRLGQSQPCFTDPLKYPLIALGSSITMEYPSKFIPGTTERQHRWHFEIHLTDNNSDHLYNKKYRYTDDEKKKTRLFLWCPN